MGQKESTRQFIAAEIKAAWPDNFPPGRIVAPEFRHITLEFLGNKKMEKFPEMAWRLPPCGIFEKWIFLERVVAAVPTFLSGNLQVEMPHVSVARTPFDKEAWMKFPCNIPFYITGLGLWKSLGYSKYETLLEQKCVAPFEEIEHTADIAYRIRGENYSQLALHATLALAFSFPALTQYLKNIPPVQSASDIVKLLNQWIAEIDSREGINLKAVSYHGTVKEKETLEWTMIVDV